MEFVTSVGTSRVVLVSTATEVTEYSWLLFILPPSVMWQQPLNFRKFSYWILVSHVGMSTTPDLLWSNCELISPRISLSSAVSDKHHSK